MIQTLQAPFASDRPTRADLIAELDALRASGSFDDVESLYGKYANTGVDVSDEDLRTTIQEVATEWKN